MSMSPPAKTTVAPIATCAETVALDALMAGGPGFSAVELMEIAGLGCFFGLRDLLDPAARVVLVCGPGQNGGDGFVVARYAATLGVPVSVVASAFPREGSAARFHFDRLLPFVVPVVSSASPAVFDAIRGADVIVDAIFGTGVRHPIRSDAQSFIDVVNAARATVVSIDLPSGLDGDTGVAPSGCVRAARTITIGTVKRGLLTAQGARAAGRVLFAPLPYPPSLTAGLRRVSVSPDGRVMGASTA
jgi:ADP-dependent NAD(P)H-hydrate dehydratase / NAD(P)H-hydrate epimerase